jgi:hypothetical protein
MSMILTNENQLCGVGSTSVEDREKLRKRDEECGSIVIGR